MSVVFLDTVGLIALWDDTDQWHLDAQRAYVELRKSRYSTITTNEVLLECGNAASRRPYRGDVNELRLQMSARSRLIAVTDDEWELAWQAYDRNEGASAGIIDQSSFIVMRRLGIQRAFTNDQHFRAAGFETLF
jgi:predicted nucleic acid-binding protein